MNLLVLGNGFDLLHGLPTTYKDFIDHLSLELSNELESLIKDNLWLIHLEKETIGEGWKDFEKEMSEVIQKLDAIRVECDTQFKSGQKVARVNEYLGTSLLAYQRIKRYSYSRSLTSNSMSRNISRCICEPPRHSEICRKTTSIEYR